ncbi:hypothetical protein FB451DRAFT_1551132, partial [Mycena latifolia]
HHFQGRGHRPPARERRRRHGLERELRRVQGRYVPPRSQRGFRHGVQRELRRCLNCSTSTPPTTTALSTGNHIIRRHHHSYAPALGAPDYFILLCTFDKFFVRAFVLICTL